MNHFVPSNLMLTFVAAVAVVCVLALLKGRRRSFQGFSIPPGPVPLPFIGSLLEINSVKPWITYTEWRNRYGDIFMIRVLKQNIIVVSSERIANDLLERRSKIYSDRPYFAPIVPFGYSFNFSFAPYGDRWRAQRKMFHQAFRPEAATSYLPIQLRKARQLILDIRSTPHDYFAHIQRFSAAVLLSIAYDYEAAPVHDNLVEQLERGNTMAVQVLTPEVSALIDAFSFTLSFPEWFPGAVLKRRAIASRYLATRIISDPFEHAKKRQSEGSNAPAMAFDFLKRVKDGGADDPLRLQLMKDTCATAIAAGTETTSSTLQCFMLAMLQHPEVQERAHTEIDAVVGTNRLPNFDDRPNLPYIEAIWLEMLRVYPVAPLGLPHATTADDVYENMFIPKGTTVVANIWAMHRNEGLYPEPDIFRPERFLKDGKLNQDKSVNDITFGFGRRVCPGRYVADNSVWMAIVSILFAFKITKARNEQGEELEFEPSFTTGITSYPNPFPCSITPRSLITEI